MARAGSSSTSSTLPTVSAIGPSSAFGPDTDAAADAALAHLQAVAPMAAWTVLRRDAGECVLEAVAGAEGGGSDALSAGTRVPWANTICSRMVDGAGPSVVPDIRRVPAYSGAPISRRLPVAAYAGVPIRLPDGSLIGSICGMDPSPQPEALVEVLPVLRLAAELIGRTRALEIEAQQQRLRAERAERRAVTDALTGITNRLGWDEALVSEQARASRRGLWTGLVSVDLDELKQINDRLGHQAGDGLLLATAESLQAVVRREDVLARVGGDEFAVLVSDCDVSRLDRLVARLRSVLDGVGVKASVGAVSVPSGTSLQHAWGIADQQMYAEKHRFDHRQLNLDLTDEALRTG